MSRAPRPAGHEAVRRARLEQRVEQGAAPRRSRSRARSRRRRCSRCARPARARPRASRSRKRKRGSAPSVASAAAASTARLAGPCSASSAGLRRCGRATSTPAGRVAHDPAIVLLDVGGVHAQEQRARRRGGRRSRRRRRRPPRCRAAVAHAPGAERGDRAACTSRSTAATAPGPAKWIWPMCETSKRPAALAHRRVLLEDRACTAPASRSRRTAPSARRAARCAA